MMIREQSQPLRHKEKLALFIHLQPRDKLGRRKGNDLAVSEIADISRDDAVGHDALCRGSLNSP